MSSPSSAATGCSTDRASMRVRRLTAAERWQVRARVINGPIISRAAPGGNRTVHEAGEYPFSRNLVIRRQKNIVLVVLPAAVLPPGTGLLDFAAGPLAHLSSLLANIVLFLDFRGTHCGVIPR